MVNIVGINSRHGLRIDACHTNPGTNQPNKSELALYKPLIQCNSHLKQLYLSSKMECFSFKGECGVCGHTHIKAFIIRTGLGYR